MNAKQVKLLRYFVKESGDIQLAALIKTRWPTMNAKKKGQLTSWLKKVTVTLMTVKAEKKKQVLKNNLDTLKGFI